jgi:hypothetical protein
LAERTAHNGFDAGSSPAMPTILIVDLTTREYQMARIKQYLIDENLCFFFQNSTEKASDWLISEQTVNSEGLQYFKFNSLSAKKAFRSSKHKLKNWLISTTTSFLRRKDKFLRFSKITFGKLIAAFIFIAIKINNIFYSSEQFKSLWVFYYQSIKALIYTFILSSLKIEKFFKLISK